MSRWYHAHKGQTVGPFTEEEIQQMLEKAQIGSMDLIFKVGGNEWKPLVEWQEFAYLKTQHNYKEITEQWIVFLDRPEEKKQIGPFTTEQIQGMIRDGKITVEDYIWKEGMSEWYPIKTLQSFKPGKETSINFNIPELKEDISVYEESAADLLKSIKVKDPKQIKEITETISKFTKDQTHTTTRTSATSTPASTQSFLNKSTLQEGLKDFFTSQKTQQYSDKEERERQKEELKLLRAQLDEKIKLMFGEESNLSKGKTALLRDKTPLKRQIDPMMDDLPLTQKLREEGFVEPKKPPTSQKIEDEPLVNILKDDHFFEKKEISLLERVGIELSALFPRGSLLRIFALFFIFFAITIIILLSSLNDKDRMAEQKQAAPEIMRQTEQKLTELERQKQRAEQIARDKREKERLDNLNRPPSQITVKVLDRSKQGRELLIETDASKHYKYNVEIIGPVGKVLEVGSYYYNFEMPVRESLRLSFQKLQIPEGYLKIKVKVDNMVKNLDFYNSNKDRGLFNQLVESHKKQIAVWHQKEKRALFSTVESLKNWGIQLSSLLPLQKQGSQRFQRAYQNWKNKVNANQSDYLKGIHRQVRSKYVYPEIWLRLRQQLDPLFALSATRPEFDYNSFKNQMTRLEDEVNNLSLW